MGEVEKEREPWRKHHIGQVLENPQNADQSETLTSLGYILGNGFLGSGNFAWLTSLQASTQASHPMHFVISMRVASSSLEAPRTAAGRLREKMNRLSHFS